MIDDNTKPIWGSKTIWINILALIAAVTGALGLDIGLTADAQVAIIGGIMAVVNIALRFVTHRPIAGGPKDGAF